MSLRHKTVKHQEMLLLAAYELQDGTEGRLKTQLSSHWDNLADSDAQSLDRDQIDCWG